VKLLLLHPEVAGRSCADCQTYLYYDRGPNDFGPRCERGGKPQRRPKGTGPPCAWCPKIFPGDDPAPPNAQDLTPLNEQVYRHYRECRAVGRFPADPVVARNAAVIREVEEHRDRLHQLRFGLTVLGSVGKGL
jgi:hypothetical protein